MHAAGASSPGNLPPDTRAVVLAARDERHLLALAERVARAGLQHVLVREPDPPFCGAATALGLAPTRDRAALRRALGRLPLLE